MRNAFTLIELIIVIIVVGILAALGINQYSKMVERGRGAELRRTLGDLQKAGYAYYLENGTCTGVTDADFGIGTGQIPNSCVPTHYFNYGADCNGGTVIRTWGYRCSVGGKPPQIYQTCYKQLNVNAVTGAQTWGTNCDVDY